MSAIQFARKVDNESVGPFRIGTGRGEENKRRLLVTKNLVVPLKFCIFVGQLHSCRSCIICWIAVV